MNHLEVARLRDAYTAYLPLPANLEPHLEGALQHVLRNPGNLVRPQIVFQMSVAHGLPDVHAIELAIALEYFHTASLLFDDLPCMDDAAIRRGIPCVHKVYGEEVAWLAGIALLNQSYAIFGKVPALIAEACLCIGTEGMICGQALDLAPHDGDDEALLQRSADLVERYKKTSSMMRLSLTAGALALGIPAAEVAPLGDAGMALGEAYQIGDDLLDMRRSSEALGKPAGQDQRHHRPTAGLLEEERCFDQLTSLLAGARETIQTAYGSRAGALMLAVDTIFNTQIAEASKVS